MTAAPQQANLRVAEAEPAPLAWEQIAPEERAFLVRFARNYVAGRRVMCWSAQAIVKIGAVVAAAAVILAFCHQVLGLRAP
jgi:hypothetical protein